MADVRLTAINPEDSQVYPVACNDKGELLLDSGGASGDLDVTGNLTVGGTATVAGEVKTTRYLFAQPTGDFAGIYNYGTNSTFTQSYIQQDSSSNVTIQLNWDGSATFARSINSANSDGSKIWLNPRVGDCLQITDTTGSTGVRQIVLSNDGSAEFAGDVEIGNATVETGTGVYLNASGRVFVRKQDGTAVFQSVSGIGAQQTTNVQLNSDGSATFAGKLTAGSNSHTVYGAVIRANNSTSDTPAVFAQNYGTGLVFGGFNGLNALTSSIKSDGSASFAGNVTAPNINFKLAPEYITTLPAPLIDEGFIANDSIDLLTELIKMKLQIRDLNAFMQRSTQDDPET